jgi:hemerythrin-like metal-binding protein
MKKGRRVFTVSGRMYLLIGSVGLFMAVVGVLTYTTLNRLKVSGPLYSRIVEQKDLLADILPPPAYILETYLRTLQILGESDPAAQKQNLEKIQSLKKDFLDRSRYWEEHLPPSTVRDVLVKVSHQSALEFFNTLEKEFLPAIDKGDKLAASTLAYGKLKAQYQAHRQAIDQVVELATKNSQALEVQASREIRNRSLLLALVLGGGILFVTVYSFSMSRSLTTALQLTATQLREGAEQTSSAASHVSSASQSLAEGSSQQAASLEETSSSLEEMASMTQRNSENAGRANELAQAARVAVDHGVADMRAMEAAMDAIKQSSDDVAKILKTIDEIAFQTNLLALNAAVEAARAGESGMGFAVVADEVRTLARKSAQAAKETAAKIEGAITRSALGAQISARVAQGLREILDKVRQVAELAGEVATASKEQSQGIRQVNLAVSEMDKVTQANAASAEESASAAEELNAQADSVKDAVQDLLRLVGGSTVSTENPRASRAAPTPATPRRSELRTAISRNPSERPPAPPREATLSSVADDRGTKPLGSQKDLVTYDPALMATGVESVDQQHQELIRMINQLHQACVSGAAKEQLHEIVGFLKDYVISHFQHEEGVMQRHQCRSSSANILAHQKFLKAFTTIANDLDQNGPSTRLALTLKEAVGDWLVNHICTVDSRLRECEGTCHTEPPGRS